MEEPRQLLGEFHAIVESKDWTWPEKRGAKTSGFFGLRAGEEDHVFGSGLAFNAALKSKILKMTRGKK